jgi:phage-related holin
MNTLIQKLLLAPNWKSIAFLIFGSLAQFFAPIADFISVIALLMTADLITGIQAAQKRKEPITSNGIRRTVVKIVVYALVIIVCEKIKLTFFHDVDIKFSYGVALFIVLIELKSLSENIKTITGIDIWEKIKTLLPSQGK